MAPPRYISPQARRFKRIAEGGADVTTPAVPHGALGPAPSVDLAHIPESVAADLGTALSGKPSPSVPAGKPTPTVPSGAPAAPPPATGIPANLKALIDADVSTTLGAPPVSAAGSPPSTGPAPPTRGLGGALGAGIQQVKSMGFGGLEALGELTGMDALTRIASEGRQKADAAAEAQGPAPQFMGIHDLSSAANWAADTAVSQAPVMAPSLLGGAAGGALGALGGPAAPVTVPLGVVLGAFFPSLVMNVGDVEGQIKDKDPNAKAPGTAFIAGGIAAALDSVLPVKIMGHIATQFGREVAEKVGQEIVKRSLAKRVVAGAGVDAAIEGLTESAQEVVGELGAAHGAGQTPDWAGLPRRMAEVGAAGALMGAVGGGVEGAIDTGQGDKTPKPPPPPAGEKPAEAAVVPPAAKVNEKIITAPAKAAAAPAPVTQSESDWEVVYDQDTEEPAGWFNKKTGKVRKLEDGDPRGEAQPNPSGTPAAGTVAPKPAQPEDLPIVAQSEAGGTHPSSQADQGLTAEKPPEGNQPNPAGGPERSSTESVPVPVAGRSENVSEKAAEPTGSSLAPAVSVEHGFTHETKVPDGRGVVQPLPKSAREEQPVLQPLPRGEHAPVAEDASADTGAEDQGRLPVARERLQEAGAAEAGALPSVRGGEKPNAPPGLQRTAQGGVAVPGLPSGAAQADARSSVGADTPDAAGKAAPFVTGPAKIAEEHAADVSAAELAGTKAAAEKAGRVTTQTAEAETRPELGNVPPAGVLQAAEDNSASGDEESPAFARRRAPAAPDTPEFKNWFGDSKVVDHTGAPKVVYHGTDAEFDAFDRPDTVHVGPGMDDVKDIHRLYFTDSKKVARSYGKRVVPVHLALRNPLELDAGGKTWAAFHPTGYLRQALRDGHDGIIIKNLRDDSRGSGEPATSYIAFEPNQIKSVDNRGTFDPKDERIAFARRAKEPEEVPPPAGTNRDIAPSSDIKNAPQAAVAPVKKAGRDGLTSALPFPEGHEKRLGRLIKRDPEVGAPKNAAKVLKGAAAVGRVNLKQWQRRVEANLTPDEIESARNWYRDVIPAFRKYYGEKQGPLVAQAWLMAQVNAGPADSQLDVTRVRENVRGRAHQGLPLGGYRLTGVKLRAYLQAVEKGDLSQVPKAGSGQKIYDFVDAALGKDTRTLLGDDPRGGTPVVVDRHTLRDMGYVDEETKNWVAKRFGEKAAEGLTQDLWTSPSETQYEWAAAKMRNFTAQLNKRKWRGKSDWTPAEIQAVGWYAMAKLTDRKPMAPEEAIQAHLKNVSYELDFGAGAPFSTSIPEWSELTGEQRAEASEIVLPKILDFVVDLTGAHEFQRIAGVGGWGGGTNPAFKSRLVASPEAARDVAHMIGYLAQQTEIFSYQLTERGKGYAVGVYGEALRDTDKIVKLWDTVVARHPEFAKGFSPSFDPDGVSGLELVFAPPALGAEKTEVKAWEAYRQRIESELVPGLDAIAKELGIAVHIDLMKAETESAKNDWTKDPTGGGYLSRLSARYGPTLQSRLELFARQKLEPAIRGAIADVGGKAAPGTEARELPERGRVPGSESGLAGAGRAAEAPDPGKEGDAGDVTPAFARGAEAPLEGLPTNATISGKKVKVGPNAKLREIARAYAKKAGLTYSPPTAYVRVDPERAKRIADAFEAMAHDPANPEVKASYDAMIAETIAQWKAIEASGLKVEFITGDDPYAASPRMAVQDIEENGHLWVFPTDAGYGQGEITAELIAENPLLAETDITISGVKARANDIFRIVHDVFGHAKEGVGFRADGEENAWRAHSAMYSPLARKAMTTETRGQNSWVNYGPHGEVNRTAKSGGTVFAEQKIGLMPDWVVSEAASDATDRVLEVPGTDPITLTYSEKFAAARTELAAELRKRLDALGLKDIALHIADRISQLDQGTDGFYWRRVISVALDSKGRKFTLDHEAIHALRRLGLFTDKEWAVLEAQAKKTWLKHYNIEKTYAGETEERQLEEAVAHAFEDYQAAKAAPGRTSAVNRMFAALRHTVAALGNALRGKGFHTVDSVFADASRGALGRRADRAGSRNEPGTAPQRAAKRSVVPTFFSALTRAISGVKQSKADARQWSGIVANLPGVKKEEVDWAGLKEWLAEQKGAVTKEQIEEFLRANEVQVEEVELGGGGPHTFGTPEEQQAAEARLETARQALVNAVPGTPSWRRVSDEHHAAEMAMRDIVPGWGRAPDSEVVPTKFSQHTLPGGENYRELLLTLPAKLGRKATQEEIARGYGFDDERQSRKIVNGHLVLGSNEGNFRSGHFDQPNVLAHVRFNERTDADGKRVLFLEEIQSDFGQQLRRQRQAISAAVDANFQDIVEKMKKAGVLIEDCD